MRIGIAIFALLCTSAFAQEFFTPTPLDPAQRPALIYLQQDKPDAPDKRLFLAFKNNGTWSRVLLASGGYITLKHLAEAKVLCSVGNTAEDSRLHLADLAAGSMQVATGRRGFDPLAFAGPQPRWVNWPESNKAFVIQDSAEENSIEFITVDYATMQLAAEMIDKGKLTSTWRADLPISIAANGAHFTYADPKGALEGQERSSKFAMKVFHFSNRSVTTEDENVVVQVSKDAPAEGVWPPFGWLDFTVIAYAIVTPASADGPNQAPFTFMKADVHEHKPTQLFQQVLPLTRTGGKLETDKAINRLVFVNDTQERFAVEPVAMTLLPLPPKSDFTPSEDGGQRKLSSGTRLLFSAPATSTITPLMKSTNGKNFAYAVAAEGHATSELRVNIGEAESEVVGDPAASFSVLAWIE